jgi:hypothetical protein
MKEKILSKWVCSAQATLLSAWERRPQLSTEEQHRQLWQELRFGEDGDFLSLSVCL